MVVPAPLAQTFQGGQMTDLPEYDGGYDPTALMEIVAPGNEEAGVNYSISLSVLVGFISGGIAFPVIITEGATVSDPYEAEVTDLRVLLNKTVSSTSYVNIGSGSERDAPIMVRDLKGDAATYNIIVSFDGTCDGMASPITISAPYGGYTFNPLPDGNWYLTNT